MIQILGLRTYVDKRTGKTRVAERFFGKGWRSGSVRHLIANIDEYLEKIPPNYQWNLYYTCADCKEINGRILHSQDIIPIDIDDIDIARTEDYINIICEVLAIDRKKTGIIFSGHGLQFLIGINEPITDVTYFDRFRHLYKAMCGLINQALYIHGLDGNADTSVWSSARLMRLPNTINRKKNLPDVMATVIEGNIEQVEFLLEEKTGIPKVVEGDHIHPNAQRKLPKPDPVGVQECPFLIHCRNEQANISEPQWYAMLSIIGRLEDGEQLCHAYSNEHPEYNASETTFKYRQAIDASGPRTCDNIATLWDGCPSCVHYNEIKSPIMIRSESYISTKDSGFYEIVIDSKGNSKRGKPNYDDLVKWFAMKHDYSTMELANIVHFHNGKCWEDISRNKIHNFAEVNFDPSPTNQMCVEFEAKLKRTRLFPQEWYHVDRQINFHNGILDLDSLTMIAHSKDYGFKYVLPFNYDPAAKCPRFTKFLEEVSLNRPELINVLLEFMGYSLAGVNPILGQKALILYGDGSNGKSVFIEVLQALAGRDNYSTLSMGHEINKMESRYQLSGKLFNVSEETPTYSMVESSVFKALVSGSEIQARKLYCDSFSMRNYAKIIMACNELPKINDLSHGMLRRLIIVPFNATFTKQTRDIRLVEKLSEELPGIFNLAIEGYKRFMRQGSFSDSAVVDRTIREYVEDNDTVTNFITDHCSFEQNATTPTAQMYGSYRYYCEVSGMKASNLTMFTNRMKKILFNAYQKDCTSRVMMGGVRTRCLHGISLVAIQDKF